MKPYYESKEGVIYCGSALEVLKSLPDQSVNCCVTSPPYFGLRDYGVDGQIGLEITPEEYISKLVDVFREVKRVLRDDGVLWLNLSDSYATNRGYQVHNSIGAKDHTYDKGMKAADIGLKPKDLIGIPWMAAFALRDDGWYLRQDIIWHKPNPMPESVTDRCTKSHEYIFLLSKSQKYFYDHEAIKEPVAKSTIVRGPVDFGGKKGREYNPQKTDPNYRNGKEQWGRTFDYKESCKNGRNKRSVWTVSTKPFSGAHFATFPHDLIEPCILAGCPKGGTVIDPFFGSGTTGLVAYKHGRKFLGIELNEEYVRDIAVPRIEAETRQLRMFA